MPIIVYNNYMGLKKFLENKQKKKFKKKYKVGLCLSGGGTKGISYIGIFKAFEEHGITFDMVAGTSAGSLFGALYASGMSSSTMQKLLKDVKTSDFKKSKLGFLPSKMDKLAEKLCVALPVKNFEELKVPLYVVAVNLKTGKEEHLNTGSLVSAITGSCAIPGVFCPVKHKNMTLIDGGVSNNVPADVLKLKGCDYVVTLDCNTFRGGGTNSTKLLTQFTTSVGIMMANNSKKGLELSDIIITPDTKRFSSLKIEQPEELIEAGYIAAKSMIPEIQKLFTGKLKK